jgi:cytochrome P450
MVQVQSEAAHPAHYRLDNPLKFDLQAAAFKRDPLPTFAAMRQAGPVIPVRLPFVGRVWVTTTHESTQAMVKDNALFVQEGRHAGKSGVAGMQWWMPRSLKTITNSMLQKDEPDHRRLRKLVDTAFARRDVLAMRDNIDRIADGILDGFEGRDSVDLAGEFSRRLPLAVISELLGLPPKDRDAFADMARRALSLTNTISMMLAMGSLSRMVDYVREQVEAARRHPRPGLIGELIHAEEEGDKLDESELLSMIMLLLIAGFETTTHLISDSVIALEQHPDQKAWLLADPEGRMERAVEELARFASPVQITKPRYVARDAEFFGQPLHRGELIMAQVAAANADPAAFEAPERLELDRFPNPHLVFSSGVHFCLGQQLARVEAQSALTRLYARFPDLQLAPGPIEWIARLGIHGPKTLPVRLNGAARRLAA